MRREKSASAAAKAASDAALSRSGRLISAESLR
jgi:hypothetical protein